MVRSFGLIAFGILLTRCAQIGVLTGGEKDQTAPKIIQATPATFSKNIFPQQITLVFDEFIQLNATSSTIRVIPEDAKVTATLAKKSITLTLDGTLKQNTTYSILLNGAIKDVTEGNDSIYSFVFSTGASLDSLQANITVTDAFQQRRMKEVLVGLYDSDTAIFPRYVGLSNAQGEVILSNLPNRNFYVRAVMDLNKNGAIDRKEKQGYAFEPIMLGGSDTIRLELSIPRDTVSLSNLKIDAPGLMYAHVPQEIDLSQITLNGEQPKAFRISRDSVGIALGKQAFGTIALACGEQKLEKFFSEKEAASRIGINGAGLHHHGCIELKCTDFIGNLLEKEAWKLQMTTDSISLPIDAITFIDNRILVYAKRLSGGQGKLTIPKGAIQGISGNANENKTIEFVHYREENLGRIKLTIPASSGPRVVILEKEGKEVAMSKISSGNVTSFEHLIPGEYQLVVIEDLNGNGYWDPIDPADHQQAEPVKRYSKFPKIRMNWDMEFTVEAD